MVKNSPRARDNLGTGVLDNKENLHPIVAESIPYFNSRRGLGTDISL